MKTSISNIDTFLSRLNNQQKEVVYSKDRQLLCLSGAGTGKTHTLISKILYLTEELKFKPNELLVLTFTNAAGSELKHRYCQYSTNNLNPYFGTFHAFCYKLILENKNIRDYLGYVNSIPEILDEFGETFIYEKASILTGIKLSKKQQNISYVPSIKEKFSCSVFQRMVDKLLIQQNKITFDRLCYKICNLFTDNSPIIQKYLNQYKFVFVDEFQDTDKIQWDFVKSFYSNIVLFADIRQAIYAFRGADSSIVKKLLHNNDWKVLKLEHNYRSTDKICEFANNWVKEYKDNVETIELKSEKLGNEVKIITLDDFETNLDNINKENTAILCRTNKEVEYISKLLKRNNLSFNSNKDKTRELVLCALDEKYMTDYLLNSLTKEIRYNLIKKSFLDENYNLLDDLYLLCKDLINKIEEIKDNDNYPELKLRYDQNDLSILDIYSSNLFETSLYVGTIHSVKGLEFDTVYVYGVNSKYFNIYENEENMNLYYVACTRAKNNLVIVKNI